MNTQEKDTSKLHTAFDSNKTFGIPGLKIVSKEPLFIVPGTPVQGKISRLHEERQNGSTIAMFEPHEEKEWLLVDLIHVTMVRGCDVVLELESDLLRETLSVLRLGERSTFNRSILSASNSPAMRSYLFVNGKELALSEEQKKKLNMSFTLTSYVGTTPLDPLDEGDIKFFDSILADYQNAK